MTAGLMVLIIGVLVVGDHPRLFRRCRSQTVQLDAAHTDEDSLRTHLEMLLDARVVNLAIKHVDLVNDTTLVDVRYVAGSVPVVQEPSPVLERDGGSDGTLGAEDQQRTTEVLTEAGIRTTHLCLAPAPVRNADRRPDRDQRPRRDRKTDLERGGHHQVQAGGQTVAIITAGEAAAGGMGGMGRGRVGRAR